jgi:hypothetical protein
MMWKDLEARTLHSVAMAAYEMSLAEPDKMRIPEMRSLMKMLNEHERLLIDRRKLKNQEDWQDMLGALKVANGVKKRHTTEDVEKMMFNTADILSRIRRKSAEATSEMKEQENVVRPGEESGSAGEPENQRVEDAEKVRETNAS